MPYYMLQASYTSEALAALVKKPQNRMEPIRTAVEKLGGSLEGAWLAFGDCDTVVICQFPDAVSAAAFSMAVSAGGALKSAKTTALLTFDEAVEAMKQASKSGYRPPK